MIRPIPFKLRLMLAMPIMRLAVCIGTLANWIVPEMSEGTRRGSDGR